MEALCSIVTPLVDQALEYWVYVTAIVVVVWLYLRYVHEDYTPPLFPDAPVPEPQVYTGDEIPMKSPMDGRDLGMAYAATEEEVRECIQRARVAQRDWAKTSFAERRAVLTDLLSWVVANAETIATNSALETGKTKFEAMGGEVLPTCEKLRFMIAEGEKALAPQSRKVPLLLFLKKAHMEYHPLGVIGIIIPWNFPFHNALSHITTALFSGNGAVVKVSEWSTYSRNFIQKGVSAVLAKRGHSPELVQVLSGYGQTGAAVIKGGVDKVLFIGSPATGKHVLRAAAEVLCPVTLELGGKDPFIVLADADLSQVIPVALRSCFYNCGQNCIANERLYVQRDIYEKFVQEVGQRARALRQGNSLECDVDCGGITMPRQVDIIDELVQDAVERGARVIAGGRPNPDFPDGLYYEPTVLADVTADMRIVKEETFGPVMLLIPFDTDADVVRFANDSDFGLGSSIFTTNYSRAQAIADQLHSGMCSINEWGISALVQSLPFGGCKVSGFGSFGGAEGLRDFCRTKSMVTDRWPIRSPAPAFTLYPIPTAGPDIMRNAVGMIYGRGLLAKVGALTTMLKLILFGSKRASSKAKKDA